jgi:hypothetical protein
MCMHSHHLLFLVVPLFVIGQGERPLSREEVQHEVESFKEAIEDQKTYDPERLREMRDDFVRESAREGIDVLQKELLEEKIAAIDMQLPVTAGLPWEETAPVKQGSPEQIAERISTLVTDISNNGQRVKNLLDELDKAMSSLQMRGDFIEQSETYDALARTDNMIKDARRVVEGSAQRALLQDLFDRVENHINKAQSDLFAHVTNEYINQVRDARLARGGPSLWRRLLDSMSSTLSWLKNGFKQPVRIGQDISRVTDMVKQLQTITKEAQRQMDQVKSMYQKELTKTKMFLDRDTTQLSVASLRNIREQLSTIAQADVLSQKYAVQELEAFNNSFMTDADRVRQEVLAAITPWQMRIIGIDTATGKPYSSLYEQFKSLYTKDLIERTSATYSFKRETGKKYIPEALGFSTYTELFSAPSSEIEKRFSLTPKGTPTFIIARELTSIFSDPISRENFHAFLDADGRIDSFAKGPEAVNSLVLPPSFDRPLSDLGGAVTTLYASMVKSIEITPPDFAAVQSEVQKKITTLDKKIASMR